MGVEVSTFGKQTQLSVVPLITSEGGWNFHKRILLKVKGEHNDKEGRKGEREREKEEERKRCSL